MTRLGFGLHPDFDVLSAHADRPDVEAARSRVGRHVSQCKTCSRTVTEIRALGTAAREGRVPGAPADMWARIELGLDGDTGIPTTSATASERVVESLVVRDGEDPKRAASPKNSEAVKRAVLGLVAVIAVAAAVIGVDSRQPLAAATARRLEADREYARPGTAITFHYRPIQALADRRALTVWMYEPGKHTLRFDQALVRAGTLRRSSALAFVGAVLMPDSSPLVMFVVGDSAGDILDRTEQRGSRLPAVVLAADSLGRPRLDAFVAALGEGRGSPDEPTLSRWAARMRDLYPTAPETWILGSVYRPRGVVTDIVKLFESRERQYYGWHDRLEQRRGLSEVTEVMMANLGWELMDTARAQFWTARLMKDHPTSAYAPRLWLTQHHDVAVDSVVNLLQRYEAIYQRSADSPGVLQAGLDLAQRTGDSALIRRWYARADPSGVTWLLGGQLADLARDSAARSDLTHRLHAALVATESEAHAGPTLFGRSNYFAWYTRERLRTRLAAVQFLGGDAEGAKSALDSISQEATDRSTCWLPETLRWRAEAERRLGLTKEARADLAYVVATGDWRVQVLSDSAPALLGGAYSKASWDSALVHANAVKDKCWTDAREARRRAGG
jgi:hypothetical protein